MRILLLAPPMSVVGGQSVQADRLIQALPVASVEENVEAELLAFPPEPRGFLLRKAQKIPLVRTAANTLTVLWRLVARARRFDVLHIFTAAGSALLLTPLPAMLIARLFGLPTVLNCHDGRAEAMLAAKPWARRVFGLADALVAPSGYLTDVFRRHGLEAGTVPNAIDASGFRYRERGELRPRFLHNRGFEELYNVPCTLRAFALVQKRYPDASLELPHDGPLRGELERLLVDLGLRNVRFLGAVSPERMAELYDEAEIYWMSPNVDNMPLSALECFASGLPLISTRAGGVPYIVEHERTGLLVDLDDHEAMAQAAFRLLEEEGLGTRLAENGRRELDRYEPGAVAREWVKAYESQIRIPTRHKM